MIKVVINACYGGFSLSKEACELGRLISGDPAWGQYYWDISRSDSTLVKVVEALGFKAGGSCAELKIVKVPEEVMWHIGERRGKEWIYEHHRIWA